MATAEIADQFFSNEARLASFKTAQPLPGKTRRSSHASSKAAKAVKWPHKFLSAEDLAEAGFFFHPTANNPDNVACFLCHKNIDGWEKDDEPLVEHLKHSPDCGWAILTAVAKGDEYLAEQYPADPFMVDARTSTFADKWPHEKKKGWKCKTKQMVDAGWKYTPTLEYDDMATCVYCNLALDGWDPKDKPLDEHYNRSPDCAFFTLIDNYKQAAKAARPKKGRASKTSSRQSTQSNATIASEAPATRNTRATRANSEAPTVDEDSIDIYKQAPKAAKPKKGKASKVSSRVSAQSNVMSELPSEGDSIMTTATDATIIKKSKGRKTTKATRATRSARATGVSTMSIDERMSINTAPAPEALAPPIPADDEDMESAAPYIEATPEPVPALEPSSSRQKRKSEEEHEQRPLSIRSHDSDEENQPPTPKAPGTRGVPWSPIQLDMMVKRDVFGGDAKGKDLTAEERSMSVEAFIKQNAALAEERLRLECERMVGLFEREGARAMAALEGMEVHI